VRPEIPALIEVNREIQFIYYLNNIIDGTVYLEKNLHIRSVRPETPALIGVNRDIQLIYYPNNIIDGTGVSKYPYKDKILGHTSTIYYVIWKRTLTFAV
jgi:hypothetical protein